MTDAVPYAVTHAVRAGPEAAAPPPPAAGTAGRAAGGTLDGAPDSAPDGAAGVAPDSAPDGAAPAAGRGAREPAANRALDRLRARAAERRAAGLRRTLTPRPPGPGDLIDLASNDYLGLARDPRVIAGAVAAVREWGAGSTGSRLVTGTTELHAELERRIAAAAGASRALVFSSGYLANLAAVTALTDPANGPANEPAGRVGALVVSDRDNHASIVDACRLARARVVVVPHRDVGAVEAALATRDEPVALVVTDAVFSVDGDLAPLPELHAAARAHGALLVVDEAHAFGVVGEGGRGAAYAAGIAGQPDVVRTVTLSKSLGSQGGAVLGAPEVIDTLIDTGRSFIFDTGLAPAAAGAALAALEVLAADPGLPGRARDRARWIAAAAAGLGLATAVPAAAVVPVVLGPPEAAVLAARICAEHGLRVGCFRPPSVPAGRACLRLTGHPSLGERELDTVAGGLAAVAARLAGSVPAPPRGGGRHHGRHHGH